MVGQQAAAVGLSLLAALVPSWERPVMNFVEVRGAGWKGGEREGAPGLCAGCIRGAGRGRERRGQGSEVSGRVAGQGGGHGVTACTWPMDMNRLDMALAHGYWG